MSDGVSLIPVVHEGKKGFLIPCGEEDIADIISSLLGRSQRVKRRFSGVFDFNKDFVLGLHGLLMQRLSQQNQYTLLAFTAEVFLENNVVRRLGSFEELAAFDEVKPVASVGLRMEWDLLIKFQGKKAPERQKVSVFISEERPKELDGYLVVGDADMINSCGYISVTISYTERTWAEDIESLISNHIESHVRQLPPYMRRLRANFPFIYFLLTVTCLLVPYAWFEVVRNNAVAQIIRKNWEAASGAGSDKVLVRLEAIHSDLVSILLGVGGASALKIFYIALGIALAVCAMLVIVRVPPSFIVLTKASIRKREDRLARYRRRSLVPMLVFVISVAAGVAGNYVYAYLVS